MIRGWNTTEEMEYHYKLILRLMWLLNSAPYEMNVRVEFKNASHTGVIKWTSDNGDWKRENIMRFVPQTLEERVADLTDQIMVAVYGPEGVLFNEVEANITIELCWNGTIRPRYMHFQNERQMKEWVNVHEDWMTYNRL